MKQIRRLFLVLLVLLFLCAYLPMMTPSSSAVTAPTMVLQSTTAVNPILDYPLDFDIYSSGGPFTVTFQWKTDNLQPLDSSDPASYGTVLIYGTSYGSIEQQANPNLTIFANTDWTTQSFVFQNVGTYSYSSVTLPGNFLRFALWNAKGELRVRNLIIQNAAGDVVYNLNTDPAVQRIITDMQKDGLTEKDHPDIYIEGYYDFTWAVGQYGLGRYNAFVSITDAPMPTISRPASTNSNSAPTRPPSSTTWPCTTGHKWNDDHNMCQVCSKPYSTGTKPVNTCTNETGHVYLNHYCMYCGEISPWHAACLRGEHGYNAYKICVHCGYRDPSSPICPGEHDFRNGVCRDCGQTDPNISYPPVSATYSIPTATLSTTQPPSSKPGQTTCSTGHHYLNGICIHCDAADPWHVSIPNTSATQYTGASSLTYKPTTRPSSRPATVTNATGHTVVNTNAPVLMQPEYSLNADQNTPVSSPNSTAADQNSSTPSTTPQNSGTPAHSFDPMWIIVIAVVSLAIIGGTVAFVFIKKR